MSTDNTLIFVERVNFGRKLDIRMAITHADGTISVFQPSTLHRVPEPDAHQEMGSPFLSLKPDSAQKLADELWNAGVRPTQSLQSVGSSEATGRHLNDMRAMVAKLAKVELPK